MEENYRNSKLKEIKDALRKWLDKDREHHQKLEEVWARHFASQDDHEELKKLTLEANQLRKEYDNLWKEFDEIFRDE